MKKVHTRKKRILGILSTHRKHRYYFTNVVAKKGYKSFSDKDKASAWAKENEVNTSKMELYQTRVGKKWQWRPVTRQ
jgi:hypothetical protein